MTTAVVTADFKANLKYYFDVAVNGNSVIITRPKKKNAVLISEEEYNRLQEIKDKYYISELEENNVLLAEALERIQKNPDMNTLKSNSPFKVPVIPPNTESSAAIIAIAK